MAIRHRATPRGIGLRCLILFVAAPVLLAQMAVAAEAVLSPDVFARVNGRTITVEEYQAFLRGRAKQKFYHGQVPDTELAAFRLDVRDYLILRELYAEEALRRGITADEADVQSRMAQLAKRYQDHPDWATQRARFESEVGGQLRRDSRIDRLEAQIRDAVTPDDAAVQAYYKANPEKFTTPEQLHLSLILLRVPPWGTVEEWQQAERAMDAISQRIRQGASFADQATLHSQDASADQNGDLGWVHASMLPEAALPAVKALQPGEVSDPVRLLEGYGLFHVQARRGAQLNPIERVRDRAEQLWLREARDAAWVELGTRLRAEAEVQINDAAMVADMRPGAGAVQSPAAR